MVAGFDRYYQIAICFRDEDLRADRVQEITQLDVEMSFPDQEFLYATMERMYARIWRECLGIEIETPFPRMTFARPTAASAPTSRTRASLELEDATEVTRSSEFGFKSADAVRFLRVPQEFSRATSRSSRSSQRVGGEGLAYLVYDEEGEVRSPIAKFLSEPELAHFRSDRLDVLFAADAWPATSRVLGALRSHLGHGARPDRRGRVHVPLGLRLPDVRARRGRGRWTACTIRSRGRPTTAPASRTIPSTRSRTRTT